ncbi:unnamed protein product [Spirodela intermedia]|uniref:FHA domain-containing protein n=1 Tax=Spirodela intermedia TaxID=51605 RepID=A0A7I8ID41_SPIIN|nr:unnamed protein product [Spirodela intermedia]CAA6655737.1 unnamed protein product [Spirodela intermedia]
MVWGLFPLESLPGAQEYYIFSKGAYKVGRKDCDVIIQTDRAVSRVHAEIIIDAMHPRDSSRNRSSTDRPYARIRDHSKFGTFINKESGSQPVNTFPNKEALLKDGDLLSFGTGNATFRFCLIPFIAFVDPRSLEANPSFGEAASSIGSILTHHYSPQCTHVIVEESTPVMADLIGAMVERKPVIRGTWLMNLGEKNIRTELPSFANHLPSLMLDGKPVKVVEPAARENCLQRYAFVLAQSHPYKFGSKLPLLIQLVGGNVHHVREFSSSIKDPADGGNKQMVLVIPEGSANELGFLNHFTSLPRITEAKLVAAILSGNLEPSAFEEHSFSVPSSHSTDETIVAESDLENDTATSDHVSAATKVENANKREDGGMQGWQRDTSVRAEFTSTKVGDSRIINLSKDDEPEPGNYEKSDVIYSQSLIVRDVVAPDYVGCAPEQKVINFKCFRKRETVSGNTFRNLIPFSNEPYQHCSVREGGEDSEAKEAIAEDLFNTEKARKRGAASSLHSFLARR